MQLDSENTEVTSSEASISAETTESTAEVTAAAPEAPVEGQAAALTPAEQYQADYKYKVWNEERELDPRVRGIIKSKEDEKWLKDVFERADGIDRIKQHREESNQKLAKINHEVQGVLKAADLGDYATVFNSIVGSKPELKQLLTGMGYSKDEIIRHAYEMAQLTPEQEQYYSRQSELERRNRELEMTLTSREEYEKQRKVETATQDLRTALSQPDIAPLVSAYDQAVGPGAFWDEVRKVGVAHHAMTGQDISVQQAVNEVTRLMRTGQQAFAPMQAAPQAATASRSGELPVIPSVGSGGSQTPARKKVRSLADMRAMAKELTD
jgi:uncharacterized protein YktA (UPF0223 family)